MSNFCSNPSQSPSFAEPAQALAQSEGAILVDLAYLDEVLADALR